MNERATTQPQKTDATPTRKTRGLALQRKCACGQHTVGGGECAACRKKSLARHQRAAQETAATLAGNASAKPALVMGSSTGAFGPTRHQSMSAMPSRAHSETSVQNPVAEQSIAEGAGAQRLPKSHAAGSSTTDPHAVQNRLGAGQALPHAVRRRMEGAFGQSFSQVRLHTDSHASQLSHSLNARAFTVGHHVAFGAGQYRPGTMLGDALIAHELAHVVQQRGAASAASGSTAVSSMAVGSTGYEALERDADRAATSAVASLWGGGVSGAMPRLRTGLALQRCGLSNQYGKWSISQSNTDGAGGTGRYESDVDITFNPEKKTVNCDEIAFVQNVRLLDKATNKSAEPRTNFKNRLTSTGWTIDRLDKKKYGWYGYNNNGKPSGTISPGSSPTPHKSATLSDKPGWNKSNMTWGFETCSICKSGTDSGKTYGCLTWGFEVDKSNKLTSLTPGLLNAPSAEFSEAVKKWNAQATGPKKKRNDPNQVQLGPFR